jgi:concanavalin A-like lectin/glucanase superfamily protein/calcineurin-like phosphoesterase family protein
LGSVVPTDFEIRKSLHTVSGKTSLGGDIDMTAGGLVDLNEDNSIFDTALTAEAASGSTKYRIFYWRYKGTETLVKDISIVKFKDTQDARTIVDFAFDPLPHNYTLAPWFDATGSTFVDLADDPSLDLSTFTVAAWFNTSVADYTTEAGIANKGGFGSETAGENMNYGIWMDAAEKIACGFETGAGVDNFITSPLTYNDGNWHLAVATYDGATLKLYMDGNTTPVATLVTSSTPETNAKPFTIGKNSRASDRFFTGKIDQVRVWNRAIGTSEVTALWSSESDLDSNGLVHENRFGQNNFSKIAQKLTNETTAPAGSPVWFPITNDVPSPANYGSIRAGAYIPIICRYTILGNTPPLSIKDDLSICRLYFGLAPGQSGGGEGGGEEPAPAGDFVIAYNADWDGKPKTKEMVKGITDFTPKPKLVLSGGDDVYASSPDSFYSAIKPIDNRQGSSIRFESAIGNHDDSSSILKSLKSHFGYSKFYFSFDFENVHIVILDTESSSISEQMSWLDTDLSKARNTAAIRWIFVVFHRPFYTAGSDHGADEGGLGSTFGKMMDKYEVDLVLQAHNHNSQRSFPTQYKSSNSPRILDSSNGPYADWKGVIYVIEGTGGHDSGSSLYSISHASFNAYENDSNNMNFFIISSNQGTKLTCQFVEPDGSVNHTFELNRP